MLFRAIVDACSDLSYISEQAVNRLKLAKHRTLIETSGLNNSTTGSSNFFVKAELESIYDENCKLQFRAYVVPNICDSRPISQFSTDELVPNDIQLADPSFNVPSRIDLLLGGAVDSQISLGLIIKSKCGKILFRETSLGYIANGIAPQNTCFLSSIVSESIDQPLYDLDLTLRKFWELEEIQDKRSLTDDELKAEEMYSQSTKRLDDGRYMVSLPFRNEIGSFVNMRKIAFSRFQQLERKLSTNPILRDLYHSCIDEYIQMGHMKEVNPNIYQNCYYLPHHSVLKESSSTTKLRVVFDASARDSNLISLNENLLTGPRLQADLLDLLIKFRTFRYAITADIEKMYRQIFVHPTDEKYQLLLWRKNQTEEVKTFAMNRVTFGTSSAPYLAVRTLYQLAEDEKESFPIGSKCLQEGFYVDDFIYGGDTIEDTIEIQEQTVKILKSAGFHLRKWSSNHSRLLEKIPEVDRETKSLLEFDNNCSIKTLGIRWSPSDDHFHFKIELADHPKHTKRTTLSDIAKIFDPLGWIAPSVILAKILMQEIWSEKLDWDDELPSELLSRWIKIRTELIDISEIKVPRWMQTRSTDCLIELHGFADASEKAYAAQIYLKTILDNRVEVNLLLSKTKVAPLQRLSIPRLELCAATLLAKIVNHVMLILNIPDLKTYCWSDSTIVLAWIKDSPHKRSTYVANRITEIQRLTNIEDWRHVRTKENPADLGTRGLYPSELKNNDFWWHGPTFLKVENSSYSNFQMFENPNLPEEENKRIKSTKVIIAANFLQSLITEKKPKLSQIAADLQVFENKLINQFSTLSKLCRIVAYCRRFLKANRQGQLFISPQENDAALNTLVKMVQISSFSEEISILNNNGNLPKKSKIHAINPFLSPADGLLRVNGRLANAKHISFDQRYPIILPYDHTLSEMIVQNSHIITLHGTIQETTMYVCQRYYIVRCKNLVRKICNRCVVCFRYRSQTLQQKMGQLPFNRINPDRPFANCGVDFAGPFELKMWRGRCNRFHKAYFAIFVCFATKAVHLEVVIDLSTAAFVASYRRFIARRGLAKNMYSDCGSNFIGSKKIITRSALECAKGWNSEIAQEMAKFQTVWHFNPPSAPHFGGLWEAGVKSVKYHIKRVMGTAKLTYDEFETLLLQIESCLNSRPITQIDSDPNTVVLTPGHFLIGSSLNLLPDHNLKDQKISFSDRWNYIQFLFQEVWRFWSRDYLNLLREREKWKIGRENIKIDDIVFIKDDNLPPNSWLKARVVEIHKDSEGFVRVATVKTQNSVLKRPIVKLAPLPILKT